MNFKAIKKFVIKQHCIPLRILNWLNYHCHSIYMLLMYFRVNLNTLKYWEKRWRTKDYKAIKERLLVYRQLAAKIPLGTVVLDIGCGDGALMGILKDEFNVKSYGIDFSPSAIKTLRDKGLNGNVASATNLPFDANTFDMVVALEVLEHLTLKDCKKVLSEMKRVCKDSGLIAVTVPAPGFLTPQNTPEHLRVYTMEEIQKFLSGFVQKITIESSAGRFYWLALGYK